MTLDSHTESSFNATSIFETDLPGTVVHVTADFRRSPLALAILGLLENGPMHPYGIQRLIKQWGKEQVVNVGQRTSLYLMIVRLEEAGLLTAGATEQDERYPERTVYHLTDE